jgi:hypothetical protein
MASEAGIFASSFDVTGSRCVLLPFEIQYTKNSLASFLYEFVVIQSAAVVSNSYKNSDWFATPYPPPSHRLITCEADKTIKIWKEDDTKVCYFF